MDFLKSAVASAISKGPLSAYSIGDRVDSDSSIWTLNHATKRDGGTKCSVFTFDIATSRARLPIARNAVRKARTLHHPGVVKVIDTIETDTQISIVTERVGPLSWYTRRKSLSEETLKWGLYGVARTIKFINDEASSVHGCVRSSSIFVSDSGEWKVGGFELLSSMKEDDAVIYTYSSLVPDIGRILPPEVSGGAWDAIKKSPVSAVDSFQYGLLCHECFAGSFASAEQAVQAKAVPSDMQVAWRRLLNPSAKTRLSAGNFVEQGRRLGGFFQTPLINLSDGLDKLGLMSEAERDEFFGKLEDVSTEFPEEFMKHKILPELLKSVEFGGGGPKVFSVVMQIGANLSEDEYEAQLTPVLVRLFASPDRAMRVCLLENMHLMIDHLSNKIVNDKIFPNLVTGFTDQAPLLREQTVKSILTIITKLSDRTVNGELLRYLAKTANDAEPGIRTNTTICLGKIAKNLSKATRSKVLIAAFTRSLRDPFLHARNAALLALGATVEVFTEDDVATKVLPALCPSLIDKELVVRDQANKTINLYLDRIRKYAKTLPDSATPPTATSANGAAGKPGMLPTDSSSWAGWAISSFASKVSSADGQIQPGKPSTAAPQLQPAATARVVSSAPTSRPSSAASTAAAKPHLQAAAPPLTRNTTETTKLAASFAAPEIADADDFWGSIDDSKDDDAGDADDWGAMADAAEEPDTPANGAAAPRPPRTSSKPATPVAASFDDTGAEPDFAGWLKAQQSAKAGPKALPKGLGGAGKARPAVARAASSGGGSAAGPAPAVVRKAAKPASRVVQAPAAAPKTEPTPAPAPAPAKEKEGSGDEDGWGDDW